MAQALLTGSVDTSQLQQEVDRLRGENLRLGDELNAARQEVMEARRAQQALAVLRRIFEPLHGALRAIFGELDAASIEDTPAAGRAAGGPVPEVWQSWIDRFGADSQSSKFILALLKHEALTAAQIRVHMQCSHQAVYDAAKRLNKLGLTEKNGAKYSLRQITGA